MHTITKRFEFEAAHVLPWHPGKCARQHGHSYKLEVDVTGNLNDNGIVSDFSDIKELVKKEIVDKYDHQNLNDYFGNPTAEVMAQKFFDIISAKWRGHGVISQVRLWETANSWTSYPAKPLYETESE